MSDNWTALESNPTVMNSYLKELGVKTEHYSMCDLYALEDWAVDMILKPVLGVLLLFPYNQKHKEYSKKQEEAIKVMLALL